jgi:spermidine synthase
MNNTLNNTSSNLSSKTLLTLAFLEGALVIFSELIGAKMLSSFYGSSLAVWTGVITTTIAFLTLGYFIGGKLSKKDTKEAILKNCFALAGFFVIIMPMWSEFLFIKTSSSTLYLGAIITTIFLIGPSVLLMGISSPLIIQLISLRTDEPGVVAGKVYAISTLAGIISTLVVGYVLLPHYGLLIPLTISAFLLVGISVYIKRGFFNIVLLIVISAISLKDNLTEKSDPKYYQSLYKTEGLMGQLKVMDQIYKGYGLHYRILFINGIPQTVILKNDNVFSSFWEYVYRISAVASLKQNKQALLIGMGGGSIAKELQFQGFKLDIVDIDKRMNEISQKYFNYKPLSSTTFTVDDARHFIKTTTKKYDVIVIDICSGEVQPSNVFTVEGISEIKKILNKEGIILIQYQEKINPDRISGSQSIAKTFINNGFKVYQNIEKLEVSGIILACSLDEIPFDKISKDNLTKNTLNQPWLDEFLKDPFTPITKPSNNSILLVDDKPILEKLNAETIELWRKSIIESYSLKFLEGK